MTLDEKKLLYKEKFGKAPHHLMKEDKINEKLKSVGEDVEEKKAPIKKEEAPPIVEKSKEPQEKIIPPGESTVLTESVAEIRKGNEHLVFYQNGNGDWQKRWWTDAVIKTMTSGSQRNRIRFPENSEYKLAPEKCKNC